MVCSGDVTLTTREDALVARSCTSITGALIIAWSDVATVDLPALTAVGGHVFVLENAVLIGVSLPALTTVGGGVFIQGNVALASVSFPALNPAGLTLTNNPALPECLTRALEDRLAPEHGVTGSWTLPRDETAPTCP